MGLHHDHDENFSFTESSYETDAEELNEKRRVRKLVEDRLERKKLKEEFKDEFDESGDEFDWDELDR